MTCWHPTAYCMFENGEFSMVYFSRLIERNKITRANFNPSRRNEMNAITPITVLIYSQTECVAKGKEFHSFEVHQRRCDIAWWKIEGWIPPRNEGQFLIAKPQRLDLPPKISYAWIKQRPHERDPETYATFLYLSNHPFFRTQKKTQPTTKWTNACEKHTKKLWRREKKTWSPQNANDESVEREKKNNTSAAARLLVWQVAASKKKKLRLGRREPWVFILRYHKRRQGDGRIGIEPTSLKKKVFPMSRAHIARLVIFGL